MTKKEIARNFEQIIKQPRQANTDHFFYDHIMNRSEELIQDHEQELISLMRDWLTLRDRPQTPLAIRVAERLCLAELGPDLEELNNDVMNGKCFYSFYHHVLEEVLENLSSCH